MWSYFRHSVWFIDSLNMLAHYHVTLYIAWDNVLSNNNLLTNTSEILLKSNCLPIFSLKQRLFTEPHWWASQPLLTSFCGLAPISTRRMGYEEHATQTQYFYLHKYFVICNCSGFKYLSSFFWFFWFI